MTNFKVNRFRINWKLLVVGIIVFNGIIVILFKYNIVLDQNRSIVYSI